VGVSSGVKILFVSLASASAEIPFNVDRIVDLRSIDRDQESSIASAIRRRRRIRFPSSRGWAVPPSSQVHRPA
jgi:hypothetical protein